MKNHNNRTIISIGEAAEILGVHVDTIRNWEKKGLLQSTLTPGGHRRFNRHHIENFIGKNMSEKVINKWEKTGLLVGISPDKIKNVAVGLDNQRIFNETQIGLEPAFKRVSIPMVRRVLGGTTNDFVSIILLRDDLGTPIKTGLLYKQLEQTGRHHDLNKEADHLAELCLEIIDWLAKWCKDNNKECFKFGAFGLQDNMITIYGLEKEE